MGICSTCSWVVQSLGPTDAGSELVNRNLNIKLPLLGRTNVGGCWICFKFSKWLEAENPNLLREWHKRSIPVKIVASGRIQIEKFQQDMLPPMTLDISPSSQENENTDFQVELNFMSTTRAAFNESGNHTTDDIDNLGVINQWIDTCTKNHNKCKGDDGTWYPTRLLYLGSHEQDLRLITSNENHLDGPYITLSYRWAQEPLSYTMLTLSTIKQLQHGIDIAGLPQVFKDAIKLAYHLGIKYLWIDGLCIIQNEPDSSDWKNESQKMDKIYSCAFMNISATLSHNGTESLFKERSWSAFQDSEIELKVNSIPRKYYVLDGQLWDGEITNAPLNKRGWVYQERLLARRVLHFGQSHLGWECRELDALDMFANGLPRALSMGSPSKSEITSLMHSWTQKQSDQTSDLTFIDLWQKLVTNYSKCSLTQGKDKLIAFSGVAKSMMKARNDTFAAGMWKKTMVYDLAWWRLTSDREAFPIHKTCWRAPSWSWASVDGEITFPSVFGGLQAHFIEVVELLEPIQDKNLPVAANGSVRIRGHCLPVQFDLSDQEVLCFKMRGLHFYTGDEEQNSNIDLELSNKELLEFKQKAHLLFLPLFATSFYLYGIVLTKIRGRGAHRRVGAVEIPVMVNNMPRMTREESDGQISQQSQSQVRGWLQDPSTDPSYPHPIEKSWSVAAMKLVRFLNKSRNDRRVIEIY